MATSLQFGINISSFSALKWSIDNRIVVCGDSMLKILTLLPVVEHSSEQPHLQQSFIEVDKYVYNIPKLNEKEYRNLMNSLSRDEQDMLITDQVMNPNSPTSVARKGFSAAEWSPRGGDEVGRCILAGLSHDFHLCLFSQKSSTYDWYKVCDLTEEYGKNNQFKDDRLTKYDEFCKHCHEQAIVTISWCPVVFTETVLGPDKFRQQKYSILATGSKTGRFVLWRINLPCLNESDCSVLYTVKPINSRPSIMTWSETSGILAVGYTDGQIYVLKINPNDPSQEAIVVAIYSGPDLMRISCLSIVSHPELEGEIILANKEHYILAFAISSDPDINMVSEACIEAENTLHGTGFACSQGMIFMSSADGNIQLVHLGTQDGSLQLTTEKLVVDVNTGFQKDSQSINRWLIHNVATSPNNVFMVYVARPSSPFDRHKMKRSTVVEIVPVDELLKKSRVQSSSSQTLEPRAATDIGDEATMEKMLNLLKDDKVPLYKVTDVLERYRGQCYSQAPVSCEDERLIELSLKELKLKRYQYLITYYTKYKKPSDRPLIVSYETAEEKQEQEERTKCGAKLILLVNRIMALIVGIQIRMSVECLVACQDRFERTSEVNKSLITMLDFITSRPWLMEIRPELSSTVESLEKLLKDTDVKPETCLICSSCMTRSAMTATCENGHSFGMCCKTLLLCGNMDYRSCSLCHCLVLSKSRLKDFPWLPGDEDNCSLCDGQLL